MCVLKMRFLASAVQILSLNNYTDRQAHPQTDRETDSTEIIKYPPTQIYPSVYSTGSYPEIVSLTTLIVCIAMN